MTGDQGIVLTTRDGGETWEQQASGTEHDIEGVVLGADGRLYAITCCPKPEAHLTQKLDQLLISEDQGRTWSAEPIQTPNTANSGRPSWGMAATPTDIVIVGDGNLVVRHSVDGCG